MLCYVKCYENECTGSKLNYCCSIQDISKGNNPVEEGEEGVLNVQIDPSMNKADVINKIKNACMKHFSEKKFDNSYIESDLSKQLLSM